MTRQPIIPRPYEPPKNLGYPRTFTCSHDARFNAELVAAGHIEDVPDEDEEEA